MHVVLLYYYFFVFKEIKCDNKKPYVLRCRISSNNFVQYIVCFKLLRVVVYATQKCSHESNTKYIIAAC